jgi:uncharacterized protein (DUF1778 family)
MDSKKKTDPVTLRFTSEEKERLAQLAAHEGISMSEFCRRPILRELKIEAGVGSEEGRE